MINLYGRNWTRDEITRQVGQMDQIAGIKLLENADGAERQGRVLHVWTGTGLYFHVLADRGLDIAACSYKGVPIAWQSSTGEMHPAYYEPEGLGWLRSFYGGLVLTCGLDSYGPPSVDAGEAFGQHGRYSNVPARAIGYRTAWVGDDYELEITGEVRQTRVFGENLLLRRRLSTHLGSNTINLEDVVTNEGFNPVPHMILYHCNFGFPMVSKDSELRLESTQTAARDSQAEAGLNNWQHFQTPTPGYQEQVFRHRPVVGQDGKARVELANPALKLAMRMVYDGVALPNLFEWKMMGEGLYVLGIEPGNVGLMVGRAAVRAANELPYLQPGESRTYRLSIEIVEQR